ncbi:MAG: Asp-tRNA(Asn)/Glu-tRNA(Gln) amidotransferase subunit GatB [Candidatus Aenigmatarchaeota archaeon]|nr:MAG: Asp-tRNA(Asn)/Glu-tRNA(Gln) amidotransferase subunit GatB [Candidatus Aenigmarchaeota archaeon]
MAYDASGIDKETVRKVAQVARLRLSENEVREFSKDMESILEAFEDLKEMDTENVKPTFQPIDTKNVMRDDEIEESLSQEDALDNTKQKENGYFKGPKAI